MVVDCKKSRGKQAEKLCDRKKDKRGEFSDAGESFGNCGTASITIIDQYPEGEALFSVGGQSLLGPIRTGFYSVFWTNWAGEGWGGIEEGRVTPASYSPLFWRDSFDQWTRPGYVTAVLTGGVTLESGTFCTILPASDGELIA
jgi:hypothetical protein